MKDVRDKKCDCYQDCIKLYDETDFKSIRKSKCNTDTCGWREDFHEADFQASCELNENKMKFMLNGCDISFIAEAPEDITLKELLKQTDRIQPEWCACGIRSLSPDEEKWDTEIFIEKDSVRLANEDVSAYIRDNGNWFKTKRGNT